MSEPLSMLSPSKQNIRTNPGRPEPLQHPFDFHSYPKNNMTGSTTCSTTTTASTPDQEEFHDSLSLAPDTPRTLFSDHNDQASGTASPSKTQSPSKPPLFRLGEAERNTRSDAARDDTIRFNEGLTRAMGDMQADAGDNSVVQRDWQDEGMSRIHRSGRDEDAMNGFADETEMTLSIDAAGGDDAVGDLSTISTIPADMSRFPNHRTSPTKSSRDAWSPSKQLRNSVMVSTPGTAHRQRPLHLLSASRQSNSSNEDDEATPRRPHNTGDSPMDLLNFTGPLNVHFPPPGSAPRNVRRSPSGRGGFPIRVNPSPSHHSQASIDRERSAGPRSPPRQPGYFPPQSVPMTPGEAGRSRGLLDIDLEPMATPRSIPTVTPRELETLRSQLQSRISGLEATLSGKEAEVMALKRAITDAEVRVGKTSEDLRNERAAKEDAEHKRTELEQRSREMEGVLREIKQNAFVEEREREKLRREKEESEKRAEEHEVKILELHASLETLRSQRLMIPSPHKGASGTEPATPGTIDVDAAVKHATENVARELHALYKGKHERKVADLKISYEKRWQKQVEQLRSDLKASQEEVLKLQTERDATMSGVVPGQMARVEELIRENESLVAQGKITSAKMSGLEEQVSTLKHETHQLRNDLEQERLEKGELVAQVDLFLMMSEEQARNTPLPDSPPRTDDGTGLTNGAGPTTASPNKFRTSLTAATTPGHGTSRPRPQSMLQAPTAGKFSRLPAPGESRLKAPGSNLANARTLGRGGIMENIARMGAGGRA